MKTLFLLGLALLLPASLHARTWVVDNDTTRPADFRSAQAAHDAAAVGDTLLLVGSGQMYGDLSISKAIHLLGPGYNLSQNGIVSAELGDAIIQKITLHHAADTSASGSTIRGLAVFSFIHLDGGVSDVIIDQCRPNDLSTGFNGESGIGVSNIFVRRCFIGDSISVVGGALSIYNSKFHSCRSEIGVTNNSLVIGSNVEISQCVIGSTHNIFGGTQESGTLPNRISIQNSIIGGLAPARDGVQITGSVLLQEAGNSYAGNRSASASEVLSGTLGSGDERHCQLNTNPSNPAKGAGIGGVDAGMFAGTDPYKLSGIPAIPRVTHLSTSGVASDTVGLTLNVGGEIRD